MKIFHRTASSKRMPLRVGLFAATLVFLISTLFVTLAPFFVPSSSAAIEQASNIFFPARGQVISRDGVPPNPIKFGACQGQFVRFLKTDDFLKDTVFWRGDRPQNYPNPSDQDVNRFLQVVQQSQGGWITRIGTFHDNATDAATARYIFAGIGSAYVPTIVFEGSHDQSLPALNTATSASVGDPSACNNLRAIPVSNTEWRGFEVEDNSQTVGNLNEFMTYKLTGVENGDALGDFNYWFYDGNGFKWTQQNAQRVHIGGAPDFSGGGGATAGPAIGGEWVDAATIRIPDTSSNGLYRGDIYKKHKWGGDSANQFNGVTYAYYFLDSAGNAGRAGIVWGSANGCEYPLPVGKICSGGQQNCVPFIRVQQNLDLKMDDTNLNRLNADIDQLGGSSSVLYNYTTDCSLDETRTISGYNNASNSQIWLLYSSTANAFRTVWQQPSGNFDTSNEGPYNGTYTLNTGLYKSGPNGCDGTIAPPSGGIPPGDVTFGVNWNILRENCTSVLGTLTVQALGGTAGNAGFDSQTPPPVTEVPATAEPRISCDFFTSNPLNWIVCPFIKAASSLIDYLDTTINNLLTINTDEIFNDSTEKGQAYHSAWGIFRTFALALIAISALVMVIAQAAGLEFLDAYTIKKVMPRLVAASILITVSWPLMEVLVRASNDIGQGVREVIYSPFHNFTGQLTALNGGTKFVTLLIGTGAILAFGWVALLSFLLTALLASLIAVVLLIFRQILIVFLVIIAPIAIACMILPNTQKGWKLWRDTFSGLLLVFIFISGFIAIGRVFSVVAASDQSAIGQIIAIVAYFAPYFLIPLAFRLAGGLVATVGGIVNDRSRGMFDRLRKFRSEQPGKRYHAFKEGKFAENGIFFNPKRRGALGGMARRVNNLGRRVDLGFQGRFGIGEAGRAAADIHHMSKIDDTLRNNAGLRALANDDDANAVMALGGTHEGAAREAARDLFTDPRTGVYDEARGNRALAKARAVGWNMDNAIAAQQTASQNKWRSVRPGDIGMIRRGVQRTLGENAQLAESARQGIEYFSRSNGGRMDLGGVTNSAVTGTTQRWSNPMEQRMRQLAQDQNSQYYGMSEEQIRDTAMSYGSILDGVGRTGAAAVANAHPATITALSDALQFLRNNNDLRVEGIEDAGIHAAGVMYELDRTKSAASGDTAIAINNMGKQVYGIDYSNTDIAGQIAAALPQTDRQGRVLTREQIQAMSPEDRQALLNPLANRIRAESRTYSTEMPAQLRGQDAQQQADAEAERLRRQNNT